MDSPRADATARLVGRIVDGDDHALEILVERNLAPLQRWAEGRLPGWARSSTDTGDLVQEALLSTLERLETFECRRPGSFQAYLRRAVLNRINDRIRAAKRRPHLAMTDSLRDDTPSPVEALVGKQALAYYEKAFARLKSAEQEAVHLRVELNLGYDEIAEALDKPSADAARMIVSRALARLAKEIADAR